VYAKYAPYQFLAYWHELWREYESLVGPFAQVDPECYHLLTGKFPAAFQTSCLIDAQDAPLSNMLSACLFPCADLTAADNAIVAHCAQQKRWRITEDSNKR